MNNNDPNHNHDYHTEEGQSVTDDIGAIMDDQHLHQQLFSLSSPSYERAADEDHNRLINTANNSASYDRLDMHLHQQPLYNEHQQHKLPVAFHHHDLAEQLSVQEKKLSPRKSSESTAADADTDNTNTASGVSIIKEINPNDVLLGRGSVSNYNPGNEKFRVIVEPYKKAYRAAFRENKRMIAQEIVDKIHRSGGRFLIKATSSSPHNENLISTCYQEVSNEKAVEKCLHALREKGKKPSTETVVQPPLSAFVGTMNKRKKAFSSDESTLTTLSGQQHPPPPQELSSNDVNPSTSLDQTLLKMNPLYALSSAMLEAAKRSEYSSTPSNGPEQFPSMRIKEYATELRLMSEDEKIEALRDMFGKNFSIAGEENQERQPKKMNKKKDRRYVECAITMMKLEIDMIPADDIRVLLQAQSKGCPEASSEERMEAFLCAVDWHPKVCITTAVEYLYVFCFCFFLLKNTLFTLFLVCIACRGTHGKILGEAKGSLWPRKVFPSDDA